MDVCLYTKPFAIVIFYRRYDTIRIEGPLANRSTLLSTFICILYIPCCGCFPVFTTTYTILYLPDRDDNVHLIGGTEGGEGARPIESLSIFVTIPILRYHFIFLSFFFFAFHYPFLLLFPLCGGPASFMNHIYYIDKVG